MVQTLVCMPQPRQIPQTSAAREARQTLGVLLVKRTESDELRSKVLNRRPEVLDIRTEFSNSEPTQEVSPKSYEPPRTIQIFDCSLVSGNYKTFVRVSR